MTAEFLLSFVCFRKKNIYFKLLIPTIIFKFHIILSNSFSELFHDTTFYISNHYKIYISTNTIFKHQY
ncbi:hypothetical protein Si046_01825 [Streptococcus infantarius subsp. infantarius]|nr:hypothetical protein [Streptococcus infantarius subsp. infantarius]MCO4607808.1 hypothetical protein [Streptococcus infantarius subsp. infantarius]MCO4624168.1 hypothetical protein [Streptococcus infantarius subsp. infantarius]